MIATQDVELALTEALEPIALQCREEPRRNSDVKFVKDFNATVAAKCEALCAFQVLADDGFNPDVFKSFKTLARDALNRDQSPRRAVAAALNAIEKEAECPRSLNWLREFVWVDSDKSQRARLASLSINWVARLSLALEDSNMSNWKGGERVGWQFPNRGLRLEATIDAVNDQGDLVIVGPTTDAAGAKAAYAAVIYAAAKQVPKAVLLVDPSRRTTRALRISELLDLGIQTAQSAARAILAALSGEFSVLTRTPSYYSCQDCPGLDQCREGQDFLEQPVTVRGGMRIG